MSARRFLWRWNARVLVADRRQYRAILTLIVAAATMSVAGVLTAYHLVTPPENTYGTADVIASTIGDSTGVEQALTDQAHPFGAVQRLDVPIPGSVGRLPFRSQDPSNGVTAPLLSLVDGRWPAGANEIAITDQVLDAETLGGDILIGDGADAGRELVLAGEAYTVVGVVENPTDLTDEFVLVDDIGAVHQRFDIAVERRLNQFLVEAEPASVTFPAGSGRVTVASRSSLLDARTAVALAVNGVVAIAMVEVALLVGTGFAVLARRRSRQYGLLAAAGATPAQLRSAATAAGTMVGLVGAVIGAALGVAVTAAITPALETSVNHRIGFSPLSMIVLWSVLPTVVMATVAAGIAARWPARPLSRQPVAHLLASLRPRPAPVGRTTAAGLVLAGAGVVAIVVGFTRLSTAPAVVGIVLAPIGLLLLSPLLVRMIGRWSAGLPMSARLGGRAVARHNRRSAAVVAALAIALGIPTAAVVVTASLDGYDRTKAPNLDRHTAIVWAPGAEQDIPHIPATLLPEPGGRERSAAPGTGIGDGVDERLADAVTGATVTAIQVAVTPDAALEQENFQRIGSQAAVVPLFAVERSDDSCLSCDIHAFGERDENGDEVLYVSSDAWIATPELLAAWGLPTPPDPVEAIARDEGFDLATNRDGPFGLAGDRLAVEPAMPVATSLAPALLTPAAASARGLQAATIGWLVTGADVLTEDDRASISQAAGSSLFAEFRQTPEPRSTLRAVALVAGMVAGLGVAAAAVSLFSGEAADDLRILVSIGADPRTARHMAAAFATALAASGAVLAVSIGYLALLPLLTIDDIDFPFVVPGTALIGLLVVFPALAAAVGFVTAGRRVSLIRPLPSVMLVSAALLLAAACSAQPDDDPTSSEAVPAANLADTCDPRIAASLQGWVDQGYAGSVTVLGGDRPCAIGLGPADKSTGRAIAADTTFSIGSVTKAVTAAAILDLADSGVIDLDDRAGDHVPGLGGAVNDLTIENLLIHTSGLTGYHGRDHVAMTEAEAVDAISALPISFEQGRSFSYTNAGYTLLALVVESVTDEGYRRYVADNILIDGDGNPIGGFWDGEPAAPEPRAVGYLAGGSPGQMGDFPGPHWALDGNGGIAMTGLEMAVWTRDLFSGRLLSPEATEQLTSIRKRQSSGESELPGWVDLNPLLLGEPAITSSGGGGAIGHLMDVLWLPRTDRVIVVTQSATSRNVDDLLLNIADALVSGTGVPTPPPVLEADPAVLAGMVGTYRVGQQPDDVIEIQIDAEDGRGLLVTATGPEAIAAVYPLAPGFEGEIARHEQHALALANGETAEGASLREGFEAEFGLIDDVKILASVFDGELLTYLELAVGDTRRVLVLALDANGGSQAIGLDAEMPSRWFVPRSEGGFSLHKPSPEDVAITLRPAIGATGDLEITGPTGSQVVPKADRGAGN